MEEQHLEGMVTDIKKIIGMAAIQNHDRIILHEDTLIQGLLHLVVVLTAAIIQDDRILFTHHTLVALLFHLVDVIPMIIIEHPIMVDLLQVAVIPIIDLLLVVIDHLVDHLHFLHHRILLDAIIHHPHHHHPIHVDHHHLLQEAIQ